MNKRFFLDISGIFAVVLCIIITIFFGEGSKNTFLRMFFPISDLDVIEDKAR